MRAYTPFAQPIDKTLWRFAGLPGNRGLDLTNVLQSGLPIEVFDSIHKWSDMSKADIMRIAGIKERNVARLIRVFDAAVQLFGGNKNEAWTWLKNPVRGLGAVTPMSLNCD
ncbi:unnamed protein product [Photorhabdus laumondii subsp. laumondii TTO1]|uniref:Photorhabdus luminescens subsp. laumondii TTO1 complete genome segment 11/17 n=1 Tax=Photorhabdus laumondii subsp. laumondii (strain DSM 15139 / CIP 105565 / TT01) TaxID=243265 RepID=Q7N281_PHOLL|nr:unnamed protein product [Photorhabdus laumondii subsp. laumondii TTO1]